MDVLYEIESLRYLNSEEDVWNKIGQIEYSLKPIPLRNTIDYYLTHLKDNHQLPGKIYVTLSGIGDSIKEHNSYTHKQLVYALMSMADHWDEFDQFK